LKRPRWPYPRIVAHRGGGRLAPENTLGALRLGAALGFRGVEFDVQLARCGTPVLIHDATLERTAGVRAAVARTPYADIARLDAGAWHSRRFSGERVPRYEEAVHLCRESGLWANVEIKRVAGREAAVGAAVARATRKLWRGCALPPVLSSFSRAALAGARRAAPEVPRGLLVDSIPRDWRRILRALECVALHCNYRTLDASSVALLHDAGYAVLAWTVNDRRIARRLLAWGVDSLVTDALERIGPDFR